MRKIQLISLNQTDTEFVKSYRLNRRIYYALTYDMKILRITTIIYQYKMFKKAARLQLRTGLNDYDVIREIKLRMSIIDWEISYLEIRLSSLIAFGAPSKKEYFYIPPAVNYDQNSISL